LFEYPSIPGASGQSFQEFDAYVFAKPDGRNTRWEWSRKRGWHKFGTRTRRFDETDPEYAPAITLFHASLADPVERIAKKQRWDRLVAFAEWWGDQSLAGFLSPDDTTYLSLFDVVVAEDQGLLGPRDFVKLFVDEVPTVGYLGRHHWTRGFVERVWRGEVEGASFEGVVGKGVRGEKAKAKTRAWVEAIRARYAPDEAEAIIDL